ncbi:MAG: polyprenyl synthetase family protein [Candidatus Aminicenantes bacterium]|nr:polyprenyl synthetase family protein [Candidatus Aminicenantes bacterium]
MEPQEYLSQKKKKLEQALESYLAREDSPVFAAMRYAVLDGGKRFRPLLLLASGEHFGATEELLLPYACAVEFIHNYSLIHDDLPIMDNDEFRRGKPSCHKKFGEGLALLAGDALLSYAFEVLAEAPYPGNNYHLKEVVISEIAKTIGPGGMIAGQWLDISFNPENKKIADYQETALKKTAGLIRVSAVSGARLAGVSQPLLEAIEKYGHYLGLAFQLRDDLEDLAQDRTDKEVFRPNLARLLGLESAVQLLGELLSEAIQSLKDSDIKSVILEYFAEQLKFTIEK